MKPEQQRIAIAKACGWTHKPTKLNPHFWINENYQKNSPEIIYSARNAKCLPDYLNDLNAMHEAEKPLDKMQSHAFQDHLREIVYRDSPTLGEFGTTSISHAWAEHFIWHATASQRAEAFLRTFNLWTDE